MIFYSQRSTALVSLGLLILTSRNHTQTEHTQ